MTTPTDQTTPPAEADFILGDHIYLECVKCEWSGITFNALKASQLIAAHVHQRVQEAVEELAKDKQLVDCLETLGVESIYFHDQSQLNPASQNLRSCLPYLAARARKADRE